MYRRSLSLFRWKLPDIVNYFLVLTSRSLISCMLQSSIPKVGTNTGSAKELWAITLLEAEILEVHIFLTLVKFSFVTLSLLIEPSKLMFSSCPRNVYLLLQLVVRQYHSSLRFVGCLLVYLLQLSYMHIYLYQSSYKYLEKM